MVCSSLNFKALILASSEAELRGLLPFVGDPSPSVDCVWNGETEPPSSGVSEVFVVESSILPEDLVATVQEIVSEHGHDLIVLPATRAGKETGPRLASALQAGYVDSVTSLEKSDESVVFHRLTLGGIAEETTTIRSSVKVFTGVIRNAESSNSASRDQSIRIVKLPPRMATYPRKMVVHKEGEAQGSTEVNIDQAERIVAVGRGVRSKSDVAPIAELAAVLNAKLACSRPLVEDLQWFPKEMQVGLSGVTVRPKLYVSLGISGQIQHIVGMRDSKVVVAINNDKAAPIFQYSDYGIVGDLYTVVPMLVEEIRKKKKGSE